MLYDVLISGAGPAGSIAALCLGRLGYKILLVDSASFPRDKVCGDLLVPAGLQLLRELGIYKQVITQTAYPINRARLFGPFGTELPVQFEFQSPQPEIVGIPRAMLDNQLLRVAESAGVQRCTGRVCGLNYNDHGVSVKIRKGKTYQEFQARAVIGADGVSSSIARQMGSVPWAHRGIAIRGYLSGISLDQHTLEAHFHAALWPGYAWMFPVSPDTVNIGLGMEIGYYKQKKLTLPQLLNQFLNQPRIKVRRSGKFILRQARTWPLNLGPPNWQRLIGDRCLLVGDAAGLTNAMTGGGIINAMCSGKIAAEVLSERLPKDTLMSAQMHEYLTRVKKLLGKELWMSQKIAQTLAVSPYIVEHLLKSARWTRWAYGIVNHVYQDVRIDQVKYDGHDAIRLKIQRR